MILLLHIGTIGLFMVCFIWVTNISRICILKVISLALLFSIRLRFPLNKSITYVLGSRYGNLVVKELQKFEKVDYSSRKCKLDLTFLIITYLWSWFGKDVKQGRAFNCPTTFFQIVEIWDSIFICLSISILYWTLWCVFQVFN